MPAARPQMALDDGEPTIYIARMDSHTEKQPAGTHTSPPPNIMNGNMNSNNSITQTSPAAAHLTSGSSPSLSLLPPPLPQRDARRNSYVLNALLTAKTAKTADTTTITSVAGVAGPPTPLDVYLSSEEDASSMGDLSDLSDFDFDDDELDDLDGDEATGACTVELATTASVVRKNSNSSANTFSTAATAASCPLPAAKTTAATAAPAPTHTRRHNHDTARAVSVVYVGKPSLVDLGLERAARRRSLTSRTSTSSVELSETRPSTSSGGSMLSAAPSTTASPAKQNKRNSSSGSMMASFRARKFAMTAAAMTAAANPLGRNLAPIITSLDTTLSPPHSPTSASAPVAAIAPATSATSITQPELVASPAMASPARAFTTSMLMSGPASASAASSPRTPTFGYGTSGLLRGVTRSLTLSGRRGLGRKESVAADKSDVSAASPVLLPALLPAETVNALLAPGHNNHAGNRKSLAVSFVSAMTSMNAPPPGPRNDEGPDANDTASVPPKVPRMAMAPASIVVSKKSTGSSFLGNLTGRRRSLKLL